MSFLVKILVKFLKLLPKKYIIIESEPDYCDNTFSMYDYILKNKFEKNCKLVWVVNNRNKVDKSKRTFVNDGSFINRLKTIYYNARCPLIVFCNKRIPKMFEEQKTFFLTHGSVAKNITGKYSMPADLDYLLLQSEFFEDATSESYTLTNRTQMVVLGLPRNDDLILENNIDREKLFGKSFDKMVVWYPTFRQHKNVKSRNVSSVALPIIYNHEEAQKVNEYAKKNNILIVLKPHFVQDTSYIKELNLSNILIIDDAFLKKNNIRSYQFVGLSDALITDYSSVYYDYLLTDKPIGLTWDDYDEYSQKEGFVVDMPKVFAGGEKIYDSEDFCLFLKNLAEGNDVLKEERRRINKLVNKYNDANSSQRVADFVLKLYNENK